MLLRYSVSNYKSIGHNIEFSMFPLENTDDRFLSEIETTEGTLKILKRGIFFGPNASGKTSFVESLHYVQRYILKGPSSNSMTKVNQFRGDIEELNGLTTFQFMIYANKQIYSYGFSLNRSYVHEEWLAVLDKNKFKTMFERTTNEDLITSIKIYPEYAEKNSKERNLAELLKESIKEKQAGQLFLKKLSENGSKKADIVYSWFKRIQIIYPNSKMRALPMKIQKDEQFREFLSDKLHALDTGVNQVSTIENSLDLLEFGEKYNIPNEIIHDIEEIQNGMINLNGKFFIFKEGEKRKINLIQIKFEHFLNNKPVDFNMDEESDGTQRLLNLLPILFKLDDDPSRIYVIDELDRSLHTKLTKYLVKSLGRSSGSQFLFTTHDINLINMSIFRQEEIWFIEKNGNGETCLKPFSDFELKKDQNVLKDYLAGRFGAVPTITIKEED